VNRAWINVIPCTVMRNTTGRRADTLGGDEVKMRPMQHASARCRRVETMTRPLLSTCIITQNNAASLKRAIASIESFSDEIVVVDGGSTDGTESVVRSHPKCLYLRRSFDGNFAVQKNFGFDHASGAWILELDEDEVVCGEFSADIRSCLERSSEIGFAIRRWWLCSVDPLQHVSTELFETTWIPRVFRNYPEFRYVFPKAGANSGVIHHEFEDKLLHFFARMDQWRILHFHYLLHGRADREARFAWFDKVDPCCIDMNARCYLYEDYSHRIVPCPARWRGREQWRTTSFPNLPDICEEPHSLWRGQASGALSQSQR